MTTIKPKVTLVDLELELDKLKSQEARSLTNLALEWLIPGDNFKPEVLKCYRNMKRSIASNELEIGKRWQRIIGE